MQRDRHKELHFITNRLKECVKELDSNESLCLVNEIRKVKRDMIDWAMEETSNNISQTARMLKMKRTTIQHIIKHEINKIKE